MRLRRNNLLGLVATALAALAVSVAVASASGQPGDHNGRAPDPQTTNVPYLAWLGSDVRVEKCLRFDHELSDSEVSAARLRLAVSVTGTFTVEDWTGVNEVNAGPKWVGGNTAPLEINKYGVCFSARLNSQKPGMAVVKLDVSADVLLSIKDSVGKADSQGPGLDLPELGNIAIFHDGLLQHQFLVIFMTAKAPTLHEVASTEPGGGGVADPTGNGIFSPSFPGGIDTFPGYHCHDTDVAAIGADKVRGKCEFNNGIYGIVKVDVKGTFPMGNDYSGMFAGDLVTLPDQWPDLAAKLAFDDSAANGGVPGSSPMRWDIHDNNNLGDGLFPYHPNSGLSPASGKLPDHSVASICQTGTNTSTDAVDNCLGTDDSLFDNSFLASIDASATGMSDWKVDLGPFSNLYGGTFPAIGPFDPVRPGQTYLPDGKLEPSDAPMPALRVDVKLGDTSVGALDSVNKTDVYIVNPDPTNGLLTGPEGGAGYPHNLYAPFYKAFVPASTPGSGRSGVYGSIANNFPGFVQDGIYDFWAIRGYVWRDGTNNCRAPFAAQREEHYASSADFNDRYNQQGGLYPRPTGWSHISVYTDEHGQAYVKFLPYRGLFLQPDAQGNCDISGHGVRKMGDASITATSIYPWQPVGWETSNKTSAPLTKTVNHAAAKVLQCTPKNGSTGEALCVETILDFNGDPASGVKVKFTTSQNAGFISPARYDTFTDPLNLVPTDKSVNNPAGDHFNTTDQHNNTIDAQGQFFVGTTDDNGQVGVVVRSSNSLCVNVYAENLLSALVRDNLGVVRDVKIDPTNTNKACGAAYDDGSGHAQPDGQLPPPVTPPKPGGGGGDATVSGGSGTTSQVVSLGGPVIQAQPVLSTGQTAVVASASAKLFSVKVLQTQLGRYLVINVHSKAKLAKVRIQIMGKNGKVLKTLIRTVPTNKAFKIANYKLGKTALSVRASVTA